MEGLNMPWGYTCSWGVHWQNRCFGDHCTDEVYVGVEALEP